MIKKFNRENKIHRVKFTSDLDPDPDQNETDPQYCFLELGRGNSSLSLHYVEN